MCNERGTKTKRKKETKSGKGKDGWIPVLATVDEEGNVVRTYKDLK